MFIKHTLARYSPRHLEYSNEHLTTEVTDLVKLAYILGSEGMYIKCLAQSSCLINVSD